MKIRKEVFVTEQGFVDEFDEIDGISSHILIFDGDLPVATCRVFPSENKGEFHIGRLAVIKTYRRLGVGKRILGEAEAHILAQGGTRITLHSQCSAREFYEKCGYTPFGELEYEQGCPHIGMEKLLP
jgi:predicted GNAT family N-acyltransferase